jgi:rfaE bifunctional protein nucleotidyltransferase chain/domain
MTHKKIISETELFKYWFDPNQPTLFTNGCFDLFHAGHAKFLYDAKKHGGSDGKLVVGVNSDASVSALKGSSRPIIPQDQRAFMVASHEAVDIVFIFDELDVSHYLEKIKPDFWYKGQDYNRQSLNKKELDALSRYHGKVQLLDLLENVSSTAIIRKVGNKIIEKVCC